MRVFISVVVGVDAELDELSVHDVARTEDVIVSQWRDVSVDKKHKMRERVAEIVRPFGLQTRLVVIRRANSLALLFLCMTLSALTSLRDRWLTRQLVDIVQSLFTFLSGNTDRDGCTRQVRLKRLTWPLADYERCLEFLHYWQGNVFLASAFL